jgi:hypothetical protein
MLAPHGKQMECARLADEACGRSNATGFSQDGNVPSVRDVVRERTELDELVQLKWHESLVAS